MSRILLLLEQKRNQQLLQEDLGRDHEVTIAADDAGLEQPFDLLVVDGRALDHAWEQIQDRKAREQPLFLPVLLTTSRPDVTMITRHLWRSVDELIITPIEKTELRARIHILLRARSLSLKLQERAGAAEKTAQARDEIMAMVSHDLRNPLNLVLSNASFLLDAGPALEPRQRQLVEGIHGRCQDDPAHPGPAGRIATRVRPPADPPSGCVADVANTERVCTARPGCEGEVDRVVV